MSYGRRIAASVAVALGLVLALALVGVLVVTQTDWGREQVRRITLEQIRDAAEGEVEIGAVEGDLLRGVVLIDVSIVDTEGRPFVRADTISTHYSLRSLFRQRIVLTNLRLVNADIVLDEPPGEDWNWVRIFPPDPDPVEPVRPGWGDWVELRDVTLVNSRLTVRGEWEPPEDVPPAEREKAVQLALSEETRENVVAVPGGYQNVMYFQQLNAELPLIRVAHPDRDTIPIEVARFSGIVQPFRPPAAVVHDLSGDFALTQDSLFFRGVQAALPGSRIAAEGAYALDKGDLLLQLHGAPVAFGDLRWLYPPLPEEGGGSLRLGLHLQTLVTHVVAEEMDLRVGESQVAGRLGLVIGDTVRLHDTDLRFSQVDTRLIEDLVPELELPRQGRLTGHASLAGRPEALRVDGDVTFADDIAGTSRVVAAGEVGMEDQLRFQNLRLRFEPLQTDLVREQVPQLPPGGTITGLATLDGFAEGPLRVDGDLTLRDPRTGVSRVLAAGEVDPLDDEVRFRDFRLRFAPLQVDLVRQEVPDLPARSTLVGQVRLTGTTAGLMQLDGDLTLRDPQTGPSRVLAIGGVVIGDEIGFRDLRLRFDPLQADLVRTQLELTDLPPGGTLAGNVRLSGSPTRLLQVDGEVAHRHPRLGVSRVAASGGIGMEDEVRFRDFDLRFAPLQMELVRAVAPELPLGGTLTGTATVNGSPAARLLARGDLVHVEAGERSHLIGRAEIVAEQWAAVDLRLQPLSLETVGRFAPAAGLRNQVAGTLRAQGDLRNLALSADLRLPDGGEIVTRGTLDLASEEIGYDLNTRLQVFNLATVTALAPAATSLTGVIDAQGRGFDPATMRAQVQADLAATQVDDVQVDSVRVRLAVAEGLASFDRTVVRLGTSEAMLDGSFGLVAGRHGELAYRIEIDSLHVLAPFLPAADTSVVEPRPAVREAALAQARTDAQRAERAREVERLATRRAPPPPPPLDTATIGQIPRDALAGSIQAAGSLRGNVERFDLLGRAELEEVLFQGNYVGSGWADYTLTDVGTEQSDIAFEAALDSVLAAGFALDSVAAEVQYRGERYGTGQAVLAIYQDEASDLRADLEFALSLEQNELLLRDLALRFDTETWQSTQPGVVRWSERAVEVETLELRSDEGGRISVDGRVPIEGGAADLDVEIEDLQIAHIFGLLQEDTDMRGILTLDTRVQGTLRSPRFEGRAELVEAAADQRDLPDLRTTFAYAGAELTADAELLRRGQVLAVAEGRLPIDLALAGQEGPRLLDGPLVVDIRADSLPLDALPSFTDEVEDVRGRVVGNVSVRGTFEDPALDGVIDLDLASFRIVSLGVRFDEIAGTLRLQDEVLVVDSLVAWNRGPVRITGEVDLSTLTEPGFDLEVEARDALVLDNEQGRLQVDADLTVQGPFDAVQVTGEVHARRGMLYIPEATRADVVALDDPEIAERLDTVLIAEREALVEESPLLQNLQVEIDLYIDRDIWVRSTEANVEIYTPAEVGPLAVRMNGGAGALTLEGTVNSDFGEYEFMSRRFRLTRGAVTFLGDAEINPLLQIAAEHEVQIPGREAIVIRIVIGGTAREPSIMLESNAQPPIPQTDLLSYLAFGREASSLLQQQGSALSGPASGSGDLVGNVGAIATQQLTAVAVGALLNQFERDAARQLGLDVFRIAPADLPPELWTGQGFSDLLRGTEIEAGTYILPRLFVAGHARPTPGTQPGARVEYRTPGGFRWVASLEPRFLPSLPTLAEETPDQRRVFGAFLFREWRF